MHGFSTSQCPEIAKSSFMLQETVCATEDVAYTCAQQESNCSCFVKSIRTWNPVRAAHGKCNMCL